MRDSELLDQLEEDVRDGNIHLPHFGGEIFIDLINDHRDLIEENTRMKLALEVAYQMSEDQSLDLVLIKGLGRE